jgi:hypothetical protein
VHQAVRVRLIFLLRILLISLTVWGGHFVSAQEEEEEPKKRQTTIIIGSDEYEWWLIRWTDNLVACQLFINHEGLPTDGEILEECGQETYTTWKSTPPCIQAGEGKSTFNCLGYYAYFVGNRSGRQEIIVDLPLPEVWLTITGCDLKPPENFCQQIPSLVLTGEEPLPNENITSIYALIDGVEYRCESEICEIPLKPTPLGGSPIEFWADSSFGDSSEHFTGLVRVLESGVSTDPSQDGWFVDVLSPQWRGGPIESCAQVWQAFPPPGGPPLWLSSPPAETLLASDEPYQYLAGRLIFQGLVDASDCPNNGLLSNGYADACGLTKARPMVDLWQNQFDPQILSVSQELGLPAQLMKNIFAQESQFWPGTFRVVKENGLGQLTDLGADTVLLWNPSFFNQFCPLVLTEEACSGGYLRLGDVERAILRGALANEANSDCPDCPAGVDLTHANFSVMLFAQTILANCGQVGQTITNATQALPGEVSNYEDLWRFTLANYNGGAGCLAFAIYAAWSLREPLDWENVSTHLTQPCQGVIGYVELTTR